MKQNTSLITCPVCKGNLEIREYYCTQCQTSIRGRFAIDMFAGLTEAQLDFIKHFLISQGNIKEMEKRLSISYPTVKNRLAEIIEVIAPMEKQVSYDVLEEIDRGTLSVEEALEILQSRRSNT